MKIREKSLAVLLLFTGLLLINYLASVWPASLDLTAEKVYTLSPGTKSLIGKVSEPISLELYFTGRASGLPVLIKNYAERVQEMIRQYVRASHGRITLKVIDAEPDSREEAKATAAGIQPQRYAIGAEPFYLGLVAIQAEQQKAIAALTPDREQFLEYDLSELIYGIQQIDKKRLGLITSLPLLGSPMNPVTGARGSEAQYVTKEWKHTFDLQEVKASAEELPQKLDALAVIHPPGLKPKMQFAIDQFLLAGKPVFIAVDPASEYFKRTDGQMAMFSQTPPQNLSSDLAPLFGPWGVVYDSQKVVADNTRATDLQNPANGSLIRAPNWLSLRRADFSDRALPTAKLGTLLFVGAGRVSPKAGSPLKFTPLVQTSAEAGELDTAALKFAQPDDVARMVTPSGRKTIAALFTGKFPSAFPEGMPKDTASSSATPAHLIQSSADSTLLVVADTDWLLDDYSLRKMNVLGTVAVQPLNDNLSFAANALDFLSGSQDLLSIRGKGNSVRAFTVVQAMQAEANKRYEEKLKSLEARLAQVQSKLSQLQVKSKEGNQLVATPEASKAIEDFQKQQASLQEERHTIRLALREDIDALENKLLAFNLLATPVLVCAFGLWFQRARRRPRD